MSRWRSPATRRSGQATEAESSGECLVGYRRAQALSLHSSPGVSFCGPQRLTTSIGAQTRNPSRYALATLRIRLAERLAQGGLLVHHNEAAHAKDKPHAPHGQP